MPDFDPYHDKLVSPLLAPREAGMTAREFVAIRRCGLPFPVFRFPGFTPQAAPIECYPAAGLRRLRGGALL